MSVTLRAGPGRIASRLVERLRIIAGRAVPLVWLSGLLWAMIEVVGLHVSRATPFQIVWTRYVVQTLIVLAVLIPRRRRSLLRTDRPWLQIARGLLMLGMPLAFLLAAIRLPLEQVWVVFWVAPLLVLAAAPRLLGERVGWVTWAIALVAFAGTVASTGPDLSLLALIPRLAWLLPVGMAACFALYLLLTRVLRDEPMSTGLIYTGLGVFIPLSFLLPLTWHTPSLCDALVMALIGVLGLLFLWTLDRALELGTLSQLAPHFYAQSVWAVAIHALLLSEIPNRHVLVGVVVVFAALVGAVTVGRTRVATAMPLPVA